MLVRDIMLDTYSIYSDTTDLEETPSPSLSGRSTRSRDKSEQRKNSVEKQTKYDGQRVFSVLIALDVSLMKQIVSVANVLKPE